MSASLAAQQDVDELLQTHAVDVDSLRTALGSSLPALWDDIWLLRFVLSFDDAARREEAARACIAYRQKNAAMLQLVAEGKRLPKHEVIARTCVLDHHGRTKLGEPLYVVRAGLCSPETLFKHATTEEFLEWLMSLKENSFRTCDALTRSTRKLTKCISVVNLAGVSLSMGLETRYQKCIGDSGKLSEVVYPQILGRSVIINPPGFFYVLFGLFKTFMSPRTLAKLSVCPGTGAGASAQGCPFAGSRFDVATLPTFLGGECRCISLGGCVAGIPNDCRTPPAGGPPEGVETTVCVGAGNAHELVLSAKQPGCSLAWQLSLQEKGLEFSARLVPEAGAALTLLAANKFKKEDGVVSGTALIPCAGTVHLRFDNSHSRFTSKTVTYTAIVVPPPAEADKSEAVDDVSLAGAMQSMPVAAPADE